MPSSLDKVELHQDLTYGQMKRLLDKHSSAKYNTEVLVGWDPDTGIVRYTLVIKEKNDHPS